MVPRNVGVRERRADDRMGADAPDYVARNRAAWDRWAPGHFSAGRKAWADSELRWGLWATPEARLGLLQDLAPGDDVIELGCGTAEVSAWLAQQGARPVAVDFAPRQTQYVETLQEEHGLRFPVLCENAEEVLYEDASFDLAISDYGVSLWSDPQRWLPEAARLLRPRGRLVFFTNGALLWLCMPSSGGMAGELLLRDYFARPRTELDEDGPVEFHVTHGDWVRHLRANGFVLEDLIELRPAAGARPKHSFATLDWARRWPSEEIWIARKLN